MPEFFQTQMGHKFYEGTAPRIADALERIATCLEAGNLAKATTFPTPLTEEEKELYPIEDWKYDVTNGDTKLGYEEWVQHNVESHKEDK